MMNKAKKPILHQQRNSQDNNKKERRPQITHGWLHSRQGFNLGDPSRHNYPWNVFQIKLYVSTV